MYTKFDVIPNRYSNIFRFPSPIQINLNVELNKINNGEMSLYFHRATQTEGLVIVEAQDGTEQIIEFDSGKQFQNIFDSNSEARRVNVLSGLNATQLNLRVAYQSHLLYNQDRKFNIKPFAGFQYLRSINNPYRTTAYPIIIQVQGLNIGTTFQFGIDLSNKVSFLMQLPINLLLVGYKKEEIKNPNIPPRLQTFNSFHVSAINKRTISILFGLEYSFKKKKSKKRRRRK